MVFGNERVFVFYFWYFSGKNVVCWVWVERIIDSFFKEIAKIYRFEGFVEKDIIFFIGSLWEWWLWIGYYIFYLVFNVLVW